MQRGFTLPKILMRGALALLAILVLSPVAARADVWTLADWCVQLDGVTCQPDPTPAGVNAAGWNTATGMGTLTFTFSGTGAHVGGVYLSMFQDGGFGNLSNAFGNGDVAAGGTFEVAAPGGIGTTLYDRWVGNTLANNSSVTTYVAPPNACCDVAFAMLRAFNLAAGEHATLSYHIGTVAPGGLYLYQTNYDTGDSAFLSESFQITGGGVPGVPEPGAIWLMVTAGAATLWVRRRRK
jgi:hypothetical protein